MTTQPRIDPDESDSSPKVDAEAILLARVYCLILSWPETPVPDTDKFGGEKVAEINSPSDRHSLNLTKQLDEACLTN